MRPRAYKNHLKSKFHLNAVRATALLESNCVTFQEIGKRLNVSRERVRQWAGVLGLRKGNDRQKICTYIRHAPERQEKAQRKADHIRPLIDKLAEQGLPGMCVGKRLVKCGNHLLHYKRIGYGPFFSNGYEITTVRLARWHAPSDFGFVVGHNSKENIWLVMPVEKYPRNGTLFVMPRDKGERELPGAHQNRHDYPDYIDAWHLLKPAEKSI